MKENAPSSATDFGSGVGQPILETPTGQSRLAYRWAAIVLFLGILLNSVSVFETGGATIIVYVLLVIDTILTSYLLRFRSWARLGVLVRAVLGAIIWPILLFLGNNDPFIARVMSVMHWGYSGALVLLLTGESKTWRLALGLGIFAVFTVGPVCLLLPFFALLFAAFGM